MFDAGMDVGPATAIVWLVQGLTSLRLGAFGVVGLRRPAKEWAPQALPWARVGLLLSWAGLVVTPGPWTEAHQVQWSIGFLPLLVLVHALVYVRKNGLMPRVATGMAAVAPMTTLAATGSASSWTPALELACLAVALAPALVWLARPTAGRRSPREWMTMGPLVFLSMALAMTLLATALAYRAGLDVPWHEATAIAGIPFLFILGFALSNKDLGRLGPSLAAIGLLVIATTVAVSSVAGWTWSFFVAALVYGLLGTFVKVFRVSDDEHAPSLLRVSGGMLLFGGLGTAASAASPLWLEYGAGATWGWIGPWLSIPLGIVAVLGAVCVLRRRSFGWALAGGLAVTAAASIPIVAAVGAAALLVVWVLRGRFRPGPTNVFRDLRRELRKTAIYAIHVGAVLSMGWYVLASSSLSSTEGVAAFLLRGGFILVAAALVAVLAIGGWRSDEPKANARLRPENG